MSNRNTNFWLVQRLLPNQLRSKKLRGVDANFTMYYMGAAEFEWGALPCTLMNMQKMPKPTVQEIQRRFLDQRTVAYYVGPELLKEEVQNFFVDQIKSATMNEDRTYHTKEHVGIAEAYGLSNRFNLKSEDVGWWGVAQPDEWLHKDRESNTSQRAKHAGWAIFKTREEAELWIRCVWGDLSKTATYEYRK